MLREKLFTGNDLDHAGSGFLISSNGGHRALRISVIEILTFLFVICWSGNINPLRHEYCKSEKHSRPIARGSWNSYQWKESMGYAG
jgi:hypothetical protein